jgi:hypothetical protein
MHITRERRPKTRDQRPERAFLDSSLLRVPAILRMVWLSFLQFEVQILRNTLYVVRDQLLPAVDPDSVWNAP